MGGRTMCPASTSPRLPEKTWPLSTTPEPTPLPRAAVSYRRRAEGRILSTGHEVAREWPDL